jgi:hypothetical protein
LELVSDTAINKDVGDLTNFEYMIVGLSKCGTTSLQDSLDLASKPCIKFHSNFTLFRVFNDPTITIESLVNPLESPFIFTGYRNPIDRKISQYFWDGRGAHKDKLTIIEEVRRYCLNDYSFYGESKRTEVDEDIIFLNIKRVTGIDVLDYYFNCELGYTVMTEGKFTVVPFVLEKINNLAEYLGIELVTSRVSEKDVLRIEVRNELRFTEEELDKIYSSKYCQHFYTAEQIEEFKSWERK